MPPPKISAKVKLVYWFGIHHKASINQLHLIPGHQEDPEKVGNLLKLDTFTLSSAAEQETLKSHKKMYQKRLKDVKKSAIPKFVCTTLL